MARVLLADFGPMVVAFREQPAGQPKCEVDSRGGLPLDMAAILRQALTGVPDISDLAGAAMSIEDKHFYIGPDDDPDKYRLLASVGRGGEAELWEADLVVAGGRERVAAKILHDDHSADVARWKARWAEQVELLRLVSHPGVVGVHAYFEGPRMHRPGEHNKNDRALYMVMNWIEGQDLRDWVPQHTKPEDRRLAMRYLAQVAGILDWLHSGATPSRRPIVHGDISPANVIIDRNGQAVLVDFGLIRVARHVTAVAAGTRGYTAPEILRGGEYSPASDRYAFGGLAHYVLTGTHPPEDPRQLPAGLATIAGFSDQPATVAQLAAIFSADPAARPSCTDWLRNLRLHSSTAPVRSTPLPPLAAGTPSPMPASAKTPDDRSRAKRLAAVVGALLGVAALAIMVNVIVPDGANPTSGNPGNRPDSQGSEGVPTVTGTPSASQPPSPTAPRPPVMTYLTNLEPVSISDCIGPDEWVTRPVTVEGRDYSNGLATDFASCTLSDTDCEGYIEYALSGRYTRFRTIAGLDDNTPDTTPTVFKVYLDNKVARAGTIQLRKPITIDLPVRGAVRLGLFVGNDCEEPIVALGDPTLEQQP